MNKSIGILFGAMNIVFIVILMYMDGNYYKRNILTAALWMLGINAFIAFFFSAQFGAASSVWPFSEMRRRNLENKKRIQELENEQK